MPLSASGGARIKSIQRGVITLDTVSTSLNVTITSVDPTKSVVDYLGTESGGTGVSSGGGLVRLWLTSATQIGAIRTAHQSVTATVTYQVTEYF